MVLTKAGSKYQSQRERSLHMGLIFFARMTPIRQSHLSEILVSGRLIVIGALFEATLNVRSGTVSCFRWSDLDLGGAEAKRNPSLSSFGF